ncbi:MAG: hypothetical protein HOP07_13205 [Bacteriovoracaceae bacterium]|nr:hypothetical protein [Bacteriovoracaceae bacterium]
MKFAIVDNIKSEPKKGQTGFCLSCGSLMISKCGEKKIHHWSHKGKLECDTWWENETQWHRNWKGHFPEDWQEVVHRDETTGERHIADVKTDQEWVIEFQHSFLKTDERNSRNAFYKKLVWVVDGKRLKGDEVEIMRAIENGTPFDFTRKILPSSCSLLRDWNSNHPVFFDFGQDKLIVLLPKCHDGMLYVCQFLRSEFIEIFLHGSTDKSINFQELLVNFPKYVLSLSSSVTSA